LILIDYLHHDNNQDFKVRLHYDISDGYEYRQDELDHEIHIDHSHLSCSNIKMPNYRLDYILVQGMARFLDYCHLLYSDIYLSQISIQSLLLDKTVDP